MFLQVRRVGKVPAFWGGIVGQIIFGAVDVFDAAHHILVKYRSRKGSVIMKLQLCTIEIAMRRCPGIRHSKW